MNHWSALSRGQKLATLGFATIMLAPAAYGAGVAARGIRAEKKNPAFRFSRTRKWYHRTKMRCSREAMGIFDKEAKAARLAGDRYMEASLRCGKKPFIAWEKKHRQRLMALGG